MDVVRNQVIHLLVGELALFPSGINEFRNVVKSQAESLSAPSYMEVRLCVGQQLITFALASCRTRANRIGLPYAFCGATPKLRVSDVITSTRPQARNESGHIQFRASGNYTERRAQWLATGVTKSILRGRSMPGPDWHRGFLL
jgi:hypothetical protein